MSNYLHIIRGDDYTFSTDVTLAGVEQSLAGAEVVMALYWRDYPFAGQLLGEFSTENNSIAVTGNNSSTLNITMSADATNNLAACPCAEWVLRTRTTGNKVYTLNSGLAAIVEGRPELS